MLKIDTIYKKGILFVKLYGAINKNNKNKIDDVLESAIDKVGIKYLLLNFENIYYVSSDISNIIEKWSKKIIKNDGKFFICGYHKISRKDFIKINDDILETQNEFGVFSKINI